MRLTLLTLGSRGDVQPLAALGVGLQKAGYEVRVATHHEFEPLVRGIGLDFAPIGANPRSLLESDEGRSWIENSRNPVSFMRGFSRLAAPLLERVLDDAWNACGGSDAIIYNALGGSFTFAGLHVAEKLGLPYLGTALWPQSRTRAFPSALLPLGGRSLGPLNGLSHRLAEQLFWQPFRREVNRWRQDRLTLPPLPWSGPYGRLSKVRTPLLCAWSPAVVPPPANWPAWHAVTGYWFLEPPVFQPSEDLLAFLAAGPPPVYIGFGSMTVRDQKTQTGLILEALKQAGQRGVLAGGWSGLGQELAADDVFVVGEVPHHWLFPRMAAVVTHGGAGTVGSALRSGVPTVVTPFYGDQPFWGARVATLGVGPAPVPQQKLTPARLAEAIKRATAADMQVRASRLGQQIAAEDGVFRAVEVIERYLMR